LAVIVDEVDVAGRQRLQVVDADNLFSQVGVEVLVLGRAFKVLQLDDSGTVRQLLNIWVFPGEHIHLRPTFFGHADAFDEAVFVWANWVICCHV
jgi:hypothetical protein